MSHEHIVTLGDHPSTLGVIKCVGNCQQFFLIFHVHTIDFLVTNSINYSIFETYSSNPSLDRKMSFVSIEMVINESLIKVPKLTYLGFLSVTLPL